MNKIETDRWLKNYTDVITLAETMSFITRDKGLQQEAHDNLQDFRNEIKKQKEKCIAKQDEDGANLMLALQLMSFGVLSELKMWLALKEDNPEEAWDHLITAQDALKAAPRAHKVGWVAKKRIPYQEAIERIVFPPQSFVSTGFRIKRRECTICKKDYDECNHVMGKPYMGALCNVIIQEWEPLEVSIVTEPADKKCRVTSFSEQGINRNKMTWLPEEQSRDQ